MLRSAGQVATIGQVTGFGLAMSQWLAIENAVADAREQAARAGFTDCAVGEDVVVGLLGPRCFFARVSYIGTRRSTVDAHGGHCAAASRPADRGERHQRHRRR